MKIKPHTQFPSIGGVAKIRRIFDGVVCVLREGAGFMSCDVEPPRLLPLGEESPPLEGNFFLSMFIMFDNEIF